MTEQRGEDTRSPTEHKASKALVYPFTVIASPFRAFRDITQNPSILGLLLIGGLFLLAAAGAEYARASRIFLDANNQSTSLLNSDLFASRLAFVLVQSAFSFLLNWITYAGVLFMITRLFSKKGSPMRPFFVIVGYALSVLVVYVAITALLISTLPEIHFELSLWSSGAQEDITKVYNTFGEVWNPTLASQTLNYLGPAFQFWLAMLGAIAVHASCEIKWGTAIIISTLAYFTSVLLTAFLTVV